MGAFSENQIPLGMVRVVNVERVLKKADFAVQTATGDPWDNQFCITTK